MWVTSLKNELHKDRATNRPARQWSITRRLTLLYAAGSLLMLVLATAYLYWVLAENLERDDNAFLANKVQELRRLLDERPNDKQLLAHEVQIEAEASQFIKYYIRLLDDHGHIFMETPGMTKVLSEASFPDAIGTTESPSKGTVWRSTNVEWFLLMSAKAQVKAADTTPSVIHVALDVSNDEALLVGYRRTLAAVVALGVLFSCVGGAVVARKGLQPLKEITRTIDHISASQLHERIAANVWPDELALLARSFDRMLDRLEDSFKRLSQFSADLAHELRTPINNLRGEAGVALSQTRTAEQYRSVLESSLEESARLGRLIDNLLFLARTDAPMATVNRSTVDARKAIEAVREYYEALAEDRGVQVGCDGEAVVEADPMLFRQAMSNLLSNALNYTSHGGKVAISMLQCDSVVEIAVRDDGCGISPEHLPKIFDRLYRVDPARSQHPDGAGLGLAIVKSIMTLHGGEVNVRSDIGKGSTFTLRFPGGTVLQS